MVDVAAIGLAPTGLNAARSSLETALQLLNGVKYRRKQFEVLTNRCDAMLQQYISLTTNTPEALDEMNDGVEDVRGSSESLKDMLEDVKERGFLWCLMSSDKLDTQILACEEKLESAFSTIHKFAQQDRQRQLIRARDSDQEELSSSLAKLSQSEGGMLDAIQDQNGVHRSSDEILVAVLKHVQNLPSTDDTRPESIFLRSAATVLSRMHNISKDSVVSPFVMSSVEVEFDLDAPIGRGASGQVYRGEWNGAIVAVKRIHADDARIITDEQRKQFRHEVKTWSMLHHPNIVTFYGACLETPVPFLVMKYCQFGSINNYLKRVPDADRTVLSREIALGLTFLHSKDIVHADVKSANVLISDDHHALLADFGLALKLHQIRTQSTFSANIDRRRGTLLWMAPEVLTGNAPDKAADVYSLGLTIWEVFSGDVPFRNFLSPELLIDGVVTRERRPDRPVALVDDHVWEVIQKCWRADPKVRPKAKEVQASLKTLRSSASSLSMNAARPMTTRTVSDIGLFTSDESLNTSSTAYMSGSSTSANEYFSSQKTGQSLGNDPSLFQSAPDTFESMNQSRGRDPHDRMHREASLPSRLSSAESSVDLPRLTVTSDAGIPSVVAMPQPEIPHYPMSRAGSRDPSRDRRAADADSAYNSNPPDVLEIRVTQKSGQSRKTKSRSRRGPPQDDETAKQDSPFPFTGTQSLIPESNTKKPRDRSRSQQRGGAEPISRTPRNSATPSGVEALSEPLLPFQAATTISYAPSQQPGHPRLPWGLDKFFSATNLNNTFSFVFDERFMSVLIQKATDLSKAIDYRPLGAPGSIERIVRLAMYQSIIYCDDSSSMADNGLLDIQRNLVTRMIQIPGQLRFRANNVPVDVRFINSSVSITAYTDTQINEGWKHVRPRGGNKIGTGLRSKILDPFVFDILKKHEQLQRPLLVTIITDYCPDAEARETFRNAIVQCKQMLQSKGYKSTDVLFTISTLTNDQSARQFLDELQNDRQISDVIFCTVDRLKFKYGKLQANDHELQKWLLQLMTAPIMKVEA